MTSTVYMFHSIGKLDLNDSADPHYNFSEEKFIEFLQSVGPVNSIAGTKEQKTLGAPIVTFDDGHQSNYLAALSMIDKKLGFGDFFINPSMVGKKDFMDWNQLREIAELGMSIQSHSFDHIYLSDCNGEKQKYQLQKSKEIIEDSGWLHSGDLARMDEQGYIQIVGRIKDMVIRSGENIYPKEIEDFLLNVPSNILVVLDCAYYEYVQENDYVDVHQLLNKYENLIVTKSFSKIQGLAAIRLGYGLANASLIENLNRIRQPFNINSFAQKLAISAIDDKEHIQKSIDVNKEGLKYLSEELSKLKLTTIPSVGNFISFNDWLLIVDSILLSIFTAFFKSSNSIIILF